MGLLFLAVQRTNGQQKNSVEQTEAVELIYTHVKAKWPMLPPSHFNEQIVLPGFRHMVKLQFQYRG